jgi:uncharacterized protein YceK
MKKLVLLLAVIVLSSCSTCHSRRRAQNKKWYVYQSYQNPSQYCGIMDNNHRD